MENEKEVCAATCTAVEGTYHIPIRNLSISTNFGKEGGRGKRLMYISKEQEIIEKKGLAKLILDFVILYCVTVVFYFFSFIPLITKVDQRVISHKILI